MRAAFDMAWRGGRRFAVALALTLAACEALLHVPAVRNAVPMPNPYYHASVETRARVLERFLARQGGVDVLFVGSSAVGAGVVPRMFDEVFRAKAQHEVASFNGWLSGLNPDPARLYLEKWWFERVTPRVVVQGVRYCELMSNQAAKDYDRFQLSRLEPLWLRGDPWGLVHAWLIEHVQLLHYAGFLPMYLRDFDWPPNRPRGGAVHADGSPVDARGAEGEKPKRLPTPEEAKRLHGYEVSYTEPWDPGKATFVFNSLSKTVAMCRRHGVRYVLFNVPEHPARFLLQPGGAELYRQYLAGVRQWAAREGVPFVDVTRGQVAYMGDADYTYDHFHMNAHGRSRFTRALAEAMAPVLNLD